MNKLLQKSTLSKWERVSLVLVTTLILAFTIYLTGRSFYIYAFLTEIVPFHPGTMYGDLRERLWTYDITVGFMVTFWGALIMTSFLNLFKRIFLSAVCFSIPAIFGILVCFDKISKTSRMEDLFLKAVRMEKPLYPFQAQELLLYAFLILLILWHTKILIQDRMRASY